MKSEFKVPSFISEYFNGLDAEQKAEAVARYKSWYAHDFTELFIQHLSQQREKLVQEDEEKTDFMSWFQFSYKKAHNRAKRSLLRELQSKLNWKI
ncbi:MAG: hypothetical protein Unbinned96contig1001_46 [Prokaryotic dsDNA virus sp.]|nr:MAG: hypothetical protein Unbinned96contig1001_46 [Prokaryotic dsDNA virus sp.]